MSVSLVVLDGLQHTQENPPATPPEPPAPEAVDPPKAPSKLPPPAKEGE